MRRGTLPVLLPDVRAGLVEAVPAGFGAVAGFVAGAGFAAGLGNCVTRAVDFARGELKSRGDASRRSSKVQPRGNVKRAAWSAHIALRCRASSASKFSSHTTQAMRSMP